MAEVNSALVLYILSERTTSSVAVMTKIDRNNRHASSILTGARIENPETLIHVPKFVLLLKLLSSLLPRE